MAADRVFLDANVLFSAAYQADSGLRKLWTLESADLITSAYAIDEARRNLDSDNANSRLDELLSDVETVGEHDASILTDDAGLPKKDRPILAAAAAAEATHLLTGDVRHFGPLFGRRMNGAMVLRPADYLRFQSKRDKDGD